MRAETDGVRDVVEIARAIFLARFIPEDCGDWVTEDDEVVDFCVQFGSLNATVVAVPEIVLAPDDRKPPERAVADVVEFVFVERGTDADTDQQTVVSGFVERIAVVNVPTGFKAGPIPVGRGYFEDGTGLVERVKAGAVVGGFYVGGEPESRCERRFDEFVGPEWKRAPDHVEISPPICSKTFLGKVPASDKGPFKTRKAGTDR